jgi:MFS family permease
VFQPTFASLSHVFGRKPLLLLALTFFTVGAIFCALAQNFTVMLLGRSIQGVGGGGISALTYVIVTDMVTLKDRGKWFGLISMMWAFGSVCGPIMGGAFAQKVSWVSSKLRWLATGTDSVQRWIFWINIPFCAIAFVTIPVFLKMQTPKGKLKDKVRRIDWIGSTIFIASMTSFLIPITWGELIAAKCPR